MDQDRQSVDCLGLVHSPQKIPRRLVVDRFGAKIMSGKALAAGVSCVFHHKTGG